MKYLDGNPLTWQVLQAMQISTFRGIFSYSKHVRIKRNRKLFESERNFSGQSELSPSTTLSREQDGARLKSSCI